MTPNLLTDIELAEQLERLKPTGSAHFEELLTKAVAARGNPDVNKWAEDLAASIGDLYD